MTISGVRVSAQSIEHSYESVTVLHGVGLDVEPAEFMTLLGASGSGKSTLLYAIAGLVKPDRGTVLVNDEEVTELPPERRDIGFVFQNYALFPHMSVAGNIAFALRMHKVGKATLRRRVGESMEMVGLSKLSNRYPGQLSGGQQQRVALARAISFHPRVLLLDEPLGALDRQLRHQLGLELRRLQREIGITTVYVTHDQEEAFVLSNRIAVMDHGRILQVAEPQDMYRTPSCLFVAKFLGDLNTLEGHVDVHRGQTVVRTGGVSIATSSRRSWRKGQRVTAAVRPEDLVVRDSHRPTTGFDARVDAAIFGGSWVRYELILTGGARAHSVTTSASEVIREGEKVWVAYEPSRILVYPMDDPTPPEHSPNATDSSGGLSVPTDPVAEGTALDRL